MARDDNAAGALPRAAPDLLPAALAGLPLRAGSFIVTIYGDAVEPRGARLWMGNLIETCAAVGISETLVRTAVSRLVAAGQLAGERAGRRSYYALTKAARREYLEAARRVFESPSRREWSFVHMPAGDAEAEGRLERAGFVRLASGWHFGPGTAPVAPEAIVFKATTAASRERLQALIAAHWPLEACDAAYLDVLTRFGPVAQALDDGLRPPPEQALHLRLLLVHLFRQAALRDPGLPEEAMPDDWSGRRARALFAALYLRLSEAADAHIGALFEAQDGPLPASTPATMRRLRLLAGLSE